MDFLSHHTPFVKENGERESEEKGAMNYMVEKEEKKEGEKGGRKIPRVFFQTWEHDRFSDLFRSVFLNSWKQWNPHYQFMFYNNIDCERLIQEHFEERVFHAYCNIGPGAFKADLWRYCVLYIYGGVYADIDTVCMSNIDEFVTDDMDFVIPIDLNSNPDDGDYNLFNAFIAAAPGCELLLRTIYRIVDNVEQSRMNSRKLDFTGPGAIGQEMNLFLGYTETTSFIGREGICSLLIPSFGGSVGDGDGDGGSRIFRVSFLHFEPRTEYVRDISSGSILLQNKNANVDWVYIYQMEIQHLSHYIRWY